MLFKDYPDSPLYTKALGAKTRLESPGKSISLKGKMINGGQVSVFCIKQHAW